MFLVTNRHIRAMKGYKSFIRTLSNSPHPSCKNYLKKSPYLSPPGTGFNYLSSLLFKPVFASVNLSIFHVFFRDFPLLGVSLVIFAQPYRVSYVY